MNFRIGERFAAHILGGEMYQDAAACLWEVVRNGLCACMGDAWDPSKTHVAVALVTNHPLAPGAPALEIMDAGSGFTKPHLDRFSTIGPDNSDLATRYSGAAQKQIGRFATFGLNSRVRSRESPSDGFFILTRTTATGNVRKYFLPAAIQTGTPLHPEIIPADAPALGTYRNHRGPFTVILVPHAIFKTEDEIREALRWRLPRKAERAVKVYVGGKLLHAPPLETKTITGEGGVEAHLQHAREGEEGGIWLCDAETTLRCAHGPALGLRLPYPLARPDLTGDIFVPQLLGAQTTNRSGLSQDFLKSDAWAIAYRVLRYRVGPFAQSILGDEDVFGDRDAGTQVVRDIAELFRKCWGPSTLRGGDGFSPPRPPRGTQEPHEPRKPKEPSDPSGNPPPSRGIAVRIGERSFFLVRYPSLPPHMYAEVTVDGTSIGVNPNYGIRVSKPTLQEHCLEKILAAVGIHEFPYDARAALERAAQLRQGLEAARRKK